MHEYLLSIVLGIIEGLTEFLPVSSTAHLRMAEALAHATGLSPVRLDDPYWKMYTVVIQLGAVLCLPVYFWPRLRKFAGTFPRGERGNRTVLTHPLSLTLIAFVVTALPAWRLSKLIGRNLESLWVMGASLLIGGIIMWIVDVICGRREAADRSRTAQPAVAAGAAAAGASSEARLTPATLSYEPAAPPHLTARLEDIGWVQAVWVGAVQILSAVFPGTSRSMATIAGGQVAGMTRATALEFSFFVSIPTMLAATGYELLKAVTGHGSRGADALAPIAMDANRWIVLAIGLVVSFGVALGVVAWFMHWVRRRGFVPFAVYRIALGIAILGWAYSTART
jgi:undecaprenyl-diphosphatase